MANTVIAPEDVQEGDKIKVSYQNGDVEQSFTGVADNFTRYGIVPAWHTSDGERLYTYLDGAVIELLDRPKPKIKLPTGKHAVVQYKCNGAVYTGRFDGSLWYMDSPVYYSPTSAPLRTTWQFENRLNDTSGTFNAATDFKVLFEGVAK